MRIRTLLLPTLLAAGSLAAGTPEWGIQGALAVPTADLADSAGMGIQGGANAKWDFGGGHGIMGRADMTLYSGKNGSTDSSFGVAADYTYHPEHNGRGLYFLGGLSLLNYSAGHGSSSGLGLDLGVGYDQDRHIGYQIRYTTHSIDSATLASLNLGVTYTF